MLIYCGKISMCLSLDSEEVTGVKNKGKYLCSIVLAAALFASVFLFSKITVYCDDYWYGSFFKEGLGGFWELTKWHYLNFNGRAFVHFAAELVIWADKYIYMLLAPLMLVSLFIFALKLQGGRLAGAGMAVAGSCVAATLALPVRFLNRSLLWMSAGFNYLFPAAFILLTLWCLARGLEKGRLGPGVLILVFLSGATTEQSGLAAFVILGGFAVCSWLRKRAGFRSALLVCLLCGIGYLTVIFAPGTWVRVGNETGGGVLEALRPGALKIRLKMALEFFTGRSGLPWLFTAFAVLTGLHALVAGRAPKLMALGLAVAVVYLVLRARGRYFSAACLGALWVVAAAAVYLIHDGTAVRGLLLGGAMASLLVMVFTTTVSERTTVPAILLLIAVCGSLALECLEKTPDLIKIAAFAALTAAFLVLALPTFRGYAKNSAIWEANARRLRDPGDVIVLSMDADRLYGHTTYLDSSSYLENALTYYGLTDEKISYSSSDGFAAGAYGENRAGLPILEKDGALYVPVQDSILLVGGESRWDFPLNGTWCRLGDREYCLKSNGEIVPFHMETRSVTGDIGHTAMWSPVYTAYAPMEVMGELFGITWTYNEAENIYYLGREG